MASYRVGTTLVECRHIVGCGHQVCQLFYEGVCPEYAENQARCNGNSNTRRAYFPRVDNVGVAVAKPRVMMHIRKGNFIRVYPSKRRLQG